MNAVRMQMLVIIFTILTVGLCQLFGQKAKPQWFDEEMGTIRTATVNMATNQNSRVARMRPGAGWNYNADGGDTAYFFDGSLFLGKDSLSLSSSLFADTTSSGGAGGHGDTLLGRLFCLSNLEIDSTSIYSYRHSHGVGCNKDSTIEFEADFYAPRHIDSSNFMIGKFSFYAGPKDSLATINNVMVAYSLDMNIPDDSADNIGGADSALQMVYQASKWGSTTSRYGAIAGLRDDGSPLVGGTVVMNSRSIDRLQGYVTDSAWTWLNGMNNFTGTDSVGDLHSILLFSRTATITPKAQGMFTIWVIFAGQSKPGGSLPGLSEAVYRARIFMCNNLNPDPALCDFYCTRCGDCNDDGVINISDAICTICYIFLALCPIVPGDCNYPMGMGDANGDGVFNISDAVYIIAYIFAGGAAPHCQGM